MKAFILGLSVLSTGVFANEWTETFKLPEGMTYRARMAGYDCGTFVTSPSGYVKTPIKFSEAKVEFKQLAADKDLNKFLIEAVYPGTEGHTCVYGVYLDRHRETKTLNFTHSLIESSEGMEEQCEETRRLIDGQFLASPYEASKRGIRYIAVDVVQESNEVCESGTVRAVFDRRF